MATLKELQQFKLDESQIEMLKLVRSNLAYYKEYYARLAASKNTYDLKEYLTLESDFDYFLSEIILSNGNCLMSDFLSFRRSISFLRLSHQRLNPSYTHPLTLFLINTLVQFDKVIDTIINERFLAK